MRLLSAFAAAVALALAAAAIRAAGGGHAASSWALMTFAVAAFGGRVR